MTIETKVSKSDQVIVKYNGKRARYADVEAAMICNGDGNIEIIATLKTGIRKTYKGNRNATGYTFTDVDGNTASFNNPYGVLYIIPHDEFTGYSELPTVDELNQPKKFDTFQVGKSYFSRDFKHCAYTILKRTEKILTVVFKGFENYDDCVSRVHVRHDENGEFFTIKEEVGVNVFTEINVFAADLLAETTDKVDELNPPKPVTKTQVKRLHSLTVKIRKEHVKARDELTALKIDLHNLKAKNEHSPEPTRKQIIDSLNRAIDKAKLEYRVAQVAGNQSKANFERELYLIAAKAIRELKH